MSPHSSSAMTPWVRIGPREKAILDAGWVHVCSVPYKVSLRWLFYRLLQDGFYKGKDDYKNNFTKLFSRARHTGFGEWRPDTLEDGVRDLIIRAGGCRDEAEAVEVMEDYVLDAARLSFNHFYKQEKYVELWFEAHAMSAQFEHYTKGIDLVPMGGTASIPFKWKIAKRLEKAATKYERPIRILYFGDADPAGHIILEAVEKDVRRWCEVGFEVIWCGLTEEQARLYNIPESVEKPGFQWEALPDGGAQAIITAAIEDNLDLDLIDEAEEQARLFEEKWSSRLAAILAETEEDEDG